MKNSKPLGRKAYGSIGHLPSSRLGPGDHMVHPGQETICCVKLRDKHDRVIVTEKLDGSNCAVARIEGHIVPLIRAGYRACHGRWEQHHIFDTWANVRQKEFLHLLKDGERVVGEWLIQAHGTRYQIANPDQLFVAFDIMVGDKRLPHDEVVTRCLDASIVTAKVLSDGPPIPVSTIMDQIGAGHHGALDPVEGAVWRVERRGKFDFLGKYVRHDKQDGKYLPEVSGVETLWNWPKDRLV